MKNVIAAVLAVIVAIGLGSLFIERHKAEKVNTVMNEVTELKAFQVGAFSNQDAATDLATKLNGKVINGDNLYYVYISVLSDAENIAKMINYLNKNSIYYYMKTVDASDNFKNELYKYEELMKATTSDIAFWELNKQLINEYEVSYHAT